MSAETLSLFLDLMILGGLAATIYFALKLSKSLNAFRNSRREFEPLIQELNRNIEHAYEALTALREAAGRSGVDMQKKMDEARTLIDELKIMTKSGDNLADRLEQLADSGKSSGSARRAPSSSSSGPVRKVEEKPKPAPKPAASSATPIEDAPSFFIQDRDFSADDLDEGDLAADGNFESQAERELFMALQNRKKHG